MEAEVSTDDYPQSQRYHSEDGDSDNEDKLSTFVFDDSDSYEIKMKKIESIVAYCKIDHGLLFDYLQDLLKSASKP